MKPNLYKTTCHTCRKLLDAGQGLLFMTNGRAVYANKAQPSYRCVCAECHEAEKRAACETRKANRAITLKRIRWISEEKGAGIRVDDKFNYYLVARDCLTGAWRVNECGLNLTEKTQNQVRIWARQEYEMRVGLDDVTGETFLRQWHIAHAALSNKLYKETGQCRDISESWNQYVARIGKPEHAI